MDFDKFAPQAGFKHYYGLEHYYRERGRRDYDGFWGIWDRAFFDFSLEKLRQMPKPFAMLYFTANPHHPFTAEADILREYPQAEPLEQSVRYADRCLAEFMQKAAKEPWYKETVFVFVADHIGPPLSPLYRQTQFRYRIPLAFYAPGDSLWRGEYGGLAQQIDILPTLLGYLNYPQSKRGFFGQNLLQSPSDAGLLTYDSGMYAYLDSAYTLYYNGRESVGLYAHPLDSLYEHNLLDSLKEEAKLRQTKLLRHLHSHHSAMKMNDL